MSDERQPHPNRVEVMDTTLRDGEQTPEVAYTPEEKLQLARMLLAEVGVDRIEIAGTRVSEGERDAARKICRWAKQSDESEDCQSCAVFVFHGEILQLPVGIVSLQRPLINCSQLPRTPHSPQHGTVRRPHGEACPEAETPASFPRSRLAA